MGIRDVLKKREEQRNAKQNGDSEFPEGVTRYVRVGSHGEVNKDGRTFVILAAPDDWFFYFVHEDKTFDGKKTIHRFRKHTCLHSPREINADITKFEKPNGNVCISCAAKAKRKMYAMIPVYDLEYKTYRVLDLTEFHVMNLIGDYDKIEKSAKKFNKEYSLVGDAIHVKLVDKTYSMEAADVDEEHLEAAKQFIGMDFNYEELANFREVDDLVKILEEADPDAIDTSVLPKSTNSTNEDDPTKQF
jgi:hypothetical protein